MRQPDMSRLSENMSFLMYTLDISDQSATCVKNMKIENVTVVGFICPHAGVQKLNTSV